MKRLLLAVPLAAFAAAPAEASGGFVCRTAGARPVEISMVIGHVPGSPLVSATLIDAGRRVPVQNAQWWLDRSELRLLLVDPGAVRQEVVLRAIRNGPTYDGSLWRGGRRRWVRCREG